MNFIFHFIYFICKGKRTLHVSPCRFRVGGATVSLSVTGRGLQGDNLTGLHRAAPGSCCQGDMPQKESSALSLLSSTWQNKPYILPSGKQLFTSCPVRKVWFFFFRLDSEKTRSISTMVEITIAAIFIRFSKYIEHGAFSSLQFTSLRLHVVKTEASLMGKNPGIPVLLIIIKAC